MCIVFSFSLELVLLFNALTIFLIAYLYILRLHFFIDI